MNNDSAPPSDSNTATMPPAGIPQEPATLMVPVASLTKKSHTPQTLRRMEVRALKRAVVRFGEDDPENLETATTSATFITENADYKEVPCTYAVWKRLSGYRNTRDTKPTTKGYEVTKAGFHVWLGLASIADPNSPGKSKDLTKVQVVKVDTAPAHDFMHNALPVGAKEVDTITMTVDAEDGSINISEYPLGYSKSDLSSLLLKIDALKVLHPGLEVSAGVIVESVVGSKIVMTVA